MKIQSSVVSFPDRGPFGRSDYRGNCSGYIVQGFLERWHPDKQLLFVDPAEGSGTSRDVAKSMGIRYAGFDLQQGFNLLADDLLNVLQEEAGSIFFHPPYHQMIRYTNHPDDLSNSSTVEEFIDKTILAVLNIYRALRSGGYYGILMGNMRKKGKFWPLASMLELACPGELKEEIIKIQHNVTSMRGGFTSSANFVPVKHEKLLIFKKGGEIFALDFFVKKGEERIATSASSWRVLVAHTIRSNGGISSLQELYDAIEGSAKAKANLHWREKIRQTVQIYPEFQRVSVGQYTLL